ncbi:MAG: peptide deformylase [Nitrospinota bacterium]|nr:peptide deformylase [Nitrospinota bacterium]MDH5677387.1 peptide deformylase [Nitrospinota bacterium]MDH5755569.1 peptide deformylase [Nitrospinota bacterium]
MTIRKVAVMGNPVLRKKAAPVTPEMIGTPKLTALIEDMIETQKEYGGIGLAAPQVHESLALIVVGMDSAGDDEMEMDDNHIPRTVLLNPKITDFSTQMETDWEGCLSVPELSGQVKRSVAVTIQAQDSTGKDVQIKAEGWAARVFQHEIDHLYGILYIDRMNDMKSFSFNRELSRRQLEDRETE